MLVSPAAQNAQIQAWKDSIKESEDRGDFKGAERKKLVLEKVLNRTARFEGFPHDKLLTRCSSPNSSSRT